MNISRLLCVSFVSIFFYSMNGSGRQPLESLETLKVKISAANAQIVYLQSCMDRFVTDRAALAIENVGGFNDMLRVKDAKITDIQKKMEQLQLELRGKADTLNSLEEKVGIDGKFYTVAIGTLKRMEDVKRHLEDRLEKLNRQVASLKKENNALKKAHDAKVKQLKKELEEIKKAEQEQHVQQINDLKVAQETLLKQEIDIFILKFEEYRNGTVAKLSEYRNLLQVAAAELKKRQDIIADFKKDFDARVNIAAKKMMDELLGEMGATQEQVTLPFFEEFERAGHQPVVGNIFTFLGAQISMRQLPSFASSNSVIERSSFSSDSSAKRPRRLSGLDDKE